MQHRTSSEVSYLKVACAFYTFLERGGRKSIGGHLWKCHFRKWVCREFSRIPWGRYPVMYICCFRILSHFFWIFLDLYMLSGYGVW